MIGMERIESLGVLTPVLKVNNRNQNITFYQETLGFKVWNEENAFTDLGAGGDSQIRLILEESPSMRTRQARGLKKLNQIIIRVANPEEIEELLARGAAFSRLYRGKNGWAFEALSPEQDCFLIHSEAELSDLAEVSSEEVSFKTAGEGDGFCLTQFELEKIRINTPDVEASQAFYGHIFRTHPQIEFVAAEDMDSSDDTWDLAALELDLTLPVSLTTIQAGLAQKLGVRAFVDKRATFLSLSDPNGIDLILRP